MSSLVFRIHLVIQFCAWNWLRLTYIYVSMSNLVLWKQNRSYHWVDKRKRNPREDGIQEVCVWDKTEVIDHSFGVFFNDSYWQHRASIWLLHFWLQKVFVRNLLCLVAIYITGNSSWTNYRLSLRYTCF